MIALPAGTRIWIACGASDMRKGFDGLAALVQTQLNEDAFSGQLFVFRGRRGDRIKLLWWDGDGLCLLAKRLERGKFVWLAASAGRHCALEPSAALDAAGGDRLAATAAYADATVVGMTRATIVLVLQDSAVCRQRGARTMRAGRAMLDCP